MAGQQEDILDPSATHQDDGLPRGKREDENDLGKPISMESSYRQIFQWVRF